MDFKTESESWLLFIVFLAKTLSEMLSYFICFMHCIGVNFIRGILEHRDDDDDDDQQLKTDDN